MIHKGQIKQMLKSFGLDVVTANENLPDQRKASCQTYLYRACLWQFQLRSVIGMLLYLSGHIRPDITYAFNFAAR